MSMNKHAFLLLVVKKLNEVGSWTGNTHIQKIVDLVQSITNVNPYNFVMHHYGPYSFDLRDTLELLVSAGYVEKTIDKYGYHYRLSDKGKRFLDNNEVDERVLKATENVVTLLGKASTIILELIATIDYVTKKYGEMNEENIVILVKRLKPHFSEKIIKKALNWWKSEFNRITNEIN